MSNELDVYDPGALQPYNPGAPLQPLSPSPETWGRSDLDEVQHAPSGRALFGTALPAGTTPEQINAVLGQVSGAYLADMHSLGYPNALVQPAINFFMDNATKPPRQVMRQHSFKLPSELTGDWLAEAFANYLHQLGGTQAQKQQFLNTSLAWLAQLERQLNAQQSVAVIPAHGSTHNSADELLAGLSEADYNKVIAINNAAQAQTMQVLQTKWGEYSFRQNIEIAQQFLQSLPTSERAHFDQFTGNWVHAMNTPEVIEGLFNMAIGAGSLPKNGADIAREIASIEHCMKHERKKYLADPQLQARYRTLLDLKG